ncbi:MAG: type II secretion system F family protein [Desulfobacterales bacterium]|nr:type II secretion system F family protein [Desulfobacterales bacterium]
MTQVILFCSTFWISFVVTERIQHAALRRSALKRMRQCNSRSGPIMPVFNDSSHAFFKALGQRVMPKKEKELTAVRKKLIYAGYREKDALMILYGIKIALGAGLAVLSFIILFSRDLMQARHLLLLFIPFGAGYILPDVSLNKRIKQRQTAIFRELPDIMDLLAVCLKAGLGFDYALYRVCRKLDHIAPVLSRELGIYFLEVKSGIPRARALGNLEERNPSKELKAMVTVLHQSLSTGTDIAGALGVYTDAMREQRRQAAEEEGAKLSTKLTVPLVVFIMPALILIILGPVIINFINLARQGF